MKTQHVLTDPELSDIQLALGDAVLHTGKLMEAILHPEKLPAEVTNTPERHKAFLVQGIQKVQQYIRTAQMQTGGPRKM